MFQALEDKGVAQQAQLRAEQELEESKYAKDISNVSAENGASQSKQQTQVEDLIRQSVMGHTKQQPMIKTIPQSVLDETRAQHDKQVKVRGASVTLDIFSSDLFSFSLLKIRPL